MLKNTLRTFPLGCIPLRLGERAHGSRACFVAANRKTLLSRHEVRGQITPLLLSLRAFTSDSKEGPSGADQHVLFEQQMEELKAERQALFEFTEEDQQAWSNAGGSHKHGASFMEMVDQARRDADLESSDGEAALISTSSVDDAVENLDAVASKTLTHLSQDGKSVKMVDVGAKDATKRVAVAESKVVFPPEVLESFSTNSDEMVGPKGPIFATAKIAGIMAAKRTSELIPLCHPLPLDSVDLDIRLQEDGTAWIRCECRVTHKTGVEMEALTGASVAALTIYDMTKAVSHNIRIEGTRLISKSGGKRKVG